VPTLDIEELGFPLLDLSGRNKGKVLFDIIEIRVLEKESK
jgi:hypothetical protein